MDWDKLRVFHAVAQAGSFKHAEEILHINHSAISRHVQQLEANLKSQLFHRHARGLNLTGAGEILLETVQDIYGKLEHTKNRIIANTDLPQGPLRISTTMGFGTSWLTPRIRTFIEHYPEMEVRLLFSDRILDLAMGEADVAIRMLRPSHGDVICTQFMPFSYHLYASKDYLKRKGIPKELKDLNNHNLIILDSVSSLPLRYFNWFMDVKENHISPVLSASNSYGIYRAVCSGLGIGVVPDFMVSESDNLQPILDEHGAFDVDTYFIYPIELRKTRRIQVFKEFMLESAKDYRNKAL